MQQATIFQTSSLSVNPAQGPPYWGPGISTANNSGTAFVVGANSLFVGIAETQLIAFAVAFYLATGNVNYTAPTSGITVIGSDSSGVNVTVPGSSAVLLTPSEAQQFANQVGVYCVTY
jgi:hypothetical protein